MQTSHPPHPPTGVEKEIQAKLKARWQHLQRELATRLSASGAAKIKEALLACGIGAAVALVVIGLAQLFPLGIVLLAVVGAHFALQLWKELRA